LWHGHLAHASGGRLARGCCFVLSLLLLPFNLQFEIGNLKFVLLVLVERFNRVLLTVLLPGGFLGNANF